jgi:hypothetical protein
MAIIDNSHPDFYAGFENRNISILDENNVEQNQSDDLIIMPHRNAIRMLLKLLAYEDPGQTDLLPSYWEIEHIFPQKWESKYYHIDKKDAEQTLEHLGNKLPLEKQLNISASNGYFEKKKERYRASEISICKGVGELSAPEWNLDSIKKRDIELCKQIKAIFAQWINDYEISGSHRQPPIPTPEEQAMIDELRRKGLIN